MLSCNQNRKTNKGEKFPGWSPYVAFNDNPLFFIDPSGLKGEPSNEDPPCETCGRQKQETLLQRIIREDIIKIAKVYNLKHSLTLDDDVDDQHVNASQLFYQWVMGTGKSRRVLDENSVMGKQMLQTPEILAAIAKLPEIYRKGKVESAKFTRSLGKESQLLYPASFVNDLYENPARAFHGSFSGVAVVTKMESTTLGTSYTILVDMTDYMTATSGFRAPPSMGGYEKNISIFKGNPYGENGYFRTIEMKYSMTVKVVKYDSVLKNTFKFLEWFLH